MDIFYRYKLVSLHLSTLEFYIYVQARGITRAVPVERRRNADPKDPCWWSAAYGA